MKISLVIVLLNFSAFHLFAQNVFYDESFGIQGTSTVPYCAPGLIAVTPDGGVIQVGYIQDANQQYFQHILLNKFTENGLPDTTFMNGGTVIYQPTTSDHARDIVVLPNGKILLTGECAEFDSTSGWYATRPMIARLLPNGSPDSSFATNGIFIMPALNSFEKIIHADENSIVVTGNLPYGGVLFKLTTEGIPDPDFGTNGLQEITLDSIEFWANDGVGLTNGDLLLTGSFYDLSTETRQSVCLKFDPNGELQTNFGDNGKFTLDTYDEDLNGWSTFERFRKVRELANGNIVMEGYSNFLVCLQNNGTLDQTFGNNGILNVNTDFVQDFFLDSEENLVLGCQENDPVYNTQENISVKRYKSNGTIDTAFNGTGIFDVINDGHQLITNLCPYGEDKLMFYWTNKLGSSSGYQSKISRLNIAATLSPVTITYTAPGVYPNPFTDQLFFSGSDLYSVKIQNSLGQLIYDGTVENASAFSWGELRCGTYFIELKEKSGNRYLFPVIKI